jgi:surface carbohydrate biosynthesis protein
MGGWFSQGIAVSPRRWILLPIGFALKAREFHGNAMLAFEAAERGWGVIIGSKAIRYNAGLPRGMLIEKNIAPGTGKKIAVSLTFGQRLSACDEEGLVYNNAEEYGRRKIEKPTYDLLEMFFCWGKHQASDLVDKLGCDGEKIVIAGNPRFDLHRPELRGVFAESVDQIKREHGPFILINTKFSQYNGYYSPEAALPKMRAIGKIKTAEHEAEALGQIAFHRTGFYKFMELVEEVSRRFPEYAVIVRPHPSERHDPWKAKAQTLPNVKVICEGNVVEWILASDACVHNNCTTGVESYLLGKPAVSYRPLCDPRFDLYLPNALSAEAFDLGTVIDLVGKTLCGEQIETANEAANRAAIASQFIENLEGKRACERFLDALDTLELPEEPLAYAGGAIRDTGFIARKNLRSMRRALGRGRKVSRTWAKQSAARKRFHALGSDTVTENDLLEFLAAAQRVTCRFRDVQVAELQEELLCVFRDGS